MRIRIVVIAVALIACESPREPADLEFLAFVFTANDSVVCSPVRPDSGVAGQVERRTRLLCVPAPSGARSDSSVVIERDSLREVLRLTVIYPPRESRSIAFARNVAETTSKRGPPEACGASGAMYVWTDSGQVETLDTLSRDQRIRWRIGTDFGAPYCDPAD